MDSAMFSASWIASSSPDSWPCVHHKVDSGGIHWSGAYVAPAADACAPSNAVCVDTRGFADALQLSELPPNIRMDLYAGRALEHGCPVAITDLTESDDEYHLHLYYTDLKCTHPLIYRKNHILEYLRLFGQIGRLNAARWITLKTYYPSVFGDRSLKSQEEAEELMSKHDDQLCKLQHHVTYQILLVELLAMHNVIGWMKPMLKGISSVEAAFELFEEVSRRMNELGSITALDRVKAAAWISP